MQTRAAETQNRSWCSKRFLAFFDKLDFESTDKESGKGKILDFLIVPGKVSAKIQNESQGLQRLEISCKQFSDQQWSAVFDELSRESLYLAKILAGELPMEVEAAFTRVGLSLFPSSREEIQVATSSSVGKGRDFASNLSLFLQHLGDKLDEDPLSLFILRGRGREESVLELRRRRSSLRTVEPKVSNFLTQAMVRYEAEAVVSVPSEGYWSFGGKISDLTYSIKADDLPASLLRRLDPLPLGGLEDQVEGIIEEAYAHIAKRAQVFGLSLSRKKTTDKEFGDTDLSL